MCLRIYGHDVHAVLVVIYNRKFAWAYFSCFILGPPLPFVISSLLETLTIELLV
jgi:hypothetical protein